MTESAINKQCGGFEWTMVGRGLKSLVQSDLVGKAVPNATKYGVCPDASNGSKKKTELKNERGRAVLEEQMTMQIVELTNQVFQCNTYFADGTLNIKDRVDMGRVLATHMAYVQSRHDKLLGNADICTFGIVEETSPLFGEVFRAAHIDPVLLSKAGTPVVLLVHRSNTSKTTLIENFVVYNAQNTHNKSQVQNFKKLVHKGCRVLDGAWLIMDASDKWLVGECELSIKDLLCAGTHEPNDRSLFSCAMGAHANNHTNTNRLRGGDKGSNKRGQAEMTSGGCKGAQGVVTPYVLPTHVVVAHQAVASSIEAYVARAMGSDILSHGMRPYNTHPAMWLTNTLPLHRLHMGISSGVEVEDAKFWVPDSRLTSEVLAHRDTGDVGLSIISFGYTGDVAESEGGFVFYGLNLRPSMKGMIVLILRSSEIVHGTLPCGEHDKAWRVGISLCNNKADVTRFGRLTSAHHLPSKIGGVVGYTECGNTLDDYVCSFVPDI